MLKIIKNALALTEICVETSSINDKATWKAFQQLENLISQTKVSSKIYAELAQLINLGAAIVSPENMLAAFWLSKISDEHATKILLDALASEVYNAQFIAPWGLRHLRQSRAIKDQLIKSYTKNKTQNFAGQILGAIILIAGSDEDEWIMQELQSGLDTSVLITICRALLNHVTRKDFAISALKHIASGNSYSVKMTSGYAMALLNDIEGVNILLEGLKTSNTAEEIDWSLMYAEHLSISKAYDSIIHSLKHLDEDVRSAAIAALGPYGLSSSIDHLLSSISDKKESLNRAALNALDWITGISKVASYAEIDKNYQNRNWLTHTIKLACPNMQQHLRYWSGELLNPSIALEKLGAPSLRAPEIAFAQLRFSYGFSFQYDTDIPWVFNKDGLQELEHMIQHDSGKFKEGGYYMFGEKVNDI